MKHILSGFEPNNYGVILVAAGVDKYQHNQVFAEELVTAFEAHGVTIQKIDYVRRAEIHQIEVAGGSHQARAQEGDWSLSINSPLPAAERRVCRALPLTCVV